jgi:hypothetical protein
VNSILATIAVLGQTAPAAAPPDPGIFPQAPAMAGLGAGAVAGGITFTGLFVALVIGFIAIKVYKAKVSSIVLGVCIGVLGASGFVGQIAWTIIGIVAKVVTSLASSFG